MTAFSIFPRLEPAAPALSSVQRAVMECLLAFEDYKLTPEEIAMLARLPQDAVLGALPELERRGFMPRQYCSRLWS